jgi:hypothetical protein
MTQTRPPTLTTGKINLLFPILTIMQSRIFVSKEDGSSISLSPRISTIIVEIGVGIQMLSLTGLTVAMTNGLTIMTPMIIGRLTIIGRSIKMTNNFKEKIGTIKEMGIIRVDEVSKSIKTQK